MLLYGPNTNLGHNSILFMIECQTKYVVRCLDEMVRCDAATIDVKREAMEQSNHKTANGKITNNWSGRTTGYWWRTRKPNFAEYELS